MTEITQKSVGKLHVCVGCRKTFLYASGLSRHRKNCESATPSAGGRKCGLCDKNFASMIDLCSHLCESHCIAADIEELQFSDVREFDEWMERSQECGKFLAKETYTTTKTSVITYYFCNRSGAYESQSNGRRAAKPYGTIKCGFTCSAFVTASTDSTSGAVSVTCCLAHYKHDKNAAKLHLPDSVRLQIANYVRDKRSIDWILEKFRGKLLCFSFMLLLGPADMFVTDDYKQTSEGEMIFSKSNFIVRDDIKNVVNAFGLTLYERHTDDAISIDLLVKEAASRKDNPFFYYHPQTADNSIFTLGKLT